jgi:BolA family transcriptional regulator, general stress-responsive regulator
MSVIDELRARLARLEPVRLDIVDDSAKHAGHAGSGGGAHFRLTVVSPKFAGIGTMARHRLIYETAGDLMGGRIHALSITARTPEEAGSASM